MKIELAESAGFCFGVNRAVELVYDLIKLNKKVCTLGPIIHNPAVVHDLSSKGVRIVEDIDGVLPDETLVIRSHGVPSEIIEKIKSKHLNYIDATCPYVRKIHTIVNGADEKGSAVIIIGDQNHPEVVGIKGNTTAKVSVIKNIDGLKELLKNKPEFCKIPVIIVAQTTFNRKEWEDCIKEIKKVCTNAKVFDTICKATQKRQQEAEVLSKKADVMIIVGGRESSNTSKLVEVSKLNCAATYLIESAKDLPVEEIKKAKFIGVTAGASAPVGIIKEVLKTMSEIQSPVYGEEIENSVEKNETVVNEGVNDAESVPATDAENTEAAAVEKSFDEMTFEEALEASLKNLNTDQEVKGIVMSVSPSEIQVDIGRKHAGYVPLSELTFDPNLKASDIVSVGDVLDLIVMKTNDQDGTVLLSKRRLDAQKGWNEVLEAAEDGRVLEGFVTDVVKGGVIVVTPNGARVFVPASLTDLSKTDDLNILQKQPVSFRVIDVNRQRRRAVGSIKAVQKEKRREVEEAFWKNIEVGRALKGTVKSLTSYGAFVDIGGVDGMIHISELSWGRIKHPSEVLNVGDSVEVSVKDIDPEKKKVSLTYKKTEENPWEILKSKYQVGDTVTVKIVNITAFGAFAQIIPGIDGLIHISQIADRHIAKPQEVLSIGQEIEAKITEIDYERKRASLSIRALIEPEETNAENPVELNQAETAKPEEEPVQTEEPAQPVENETEAITE